MDSGKSAVVKKAYELAYAAFRISESVPDKRSFQEPLEAMALGLLNAALEGDKLGIEKSIGFLTIYLRFGSDAGLVSQENRDLMIAEMGKLDSALAGLNQAKNAPHVELGKIFTPMDLAAPMRNPARTRQTKSEFQTDSSSFKDREKVILERIRQLGNCRLKDITEALPDSSERTIRYDLQALLGEGVLERVGNGGPATFYRLKESLPAAPLMAPPQA